MSEKETNLTGKLKSAVIILLKTFIVIVILSFITALVFRDFLTINDLGKSVLENWLWFLLWRVILYAVVGSLLFKLNNIPTEYKVRLIKLMAMFIVAIEVTSMTQILRG